MLADEDTTGQDDEIDDNDDDDATIDAEECVRQSLTESCSSIENERNSIETPEMRTMRIKEETSVFVDDLLKECQKILTDDENDASETELSLNTQQITSNNVTLQSPSISNAKPNETQILENIINIVSSENANDDKNVTNVTRVLTPTANKTDEVSEISEDADDSSIANITVIDLAKFDKMHDTSCESENCNSDSSNIKSEESFECLFNEGISASTPVQKNKYSFPAPSEEDCAAIKMKLGFDMTVDEDDIETPVIEINNEMNIVDKTFPMPETNIKLKQVGHDNGDANLLNSNVNSNKNVNDEKELNVLVDVNETFNIENCDKVDNNETFVQDNRADGTFVKDTENAFDGTFTKESDTKDGAFVTNYNADFGPPQIKIDRDETNSEDMTTVTPVNTPIEINYSIDTWDKIISSKAQTSYAMLDANQPSTSSGSTGNSGGWFLHPPSSNDLNNDTFGIEEDEESQENLNLAFEALRKQLAEVLPHAQVIKSFFKLIFELFNVLDFYLNV